MEGVVRGEGLSRCVKERPIKILVDALSALGADITYEENEKEGKK